METTLLSPVEALTRNFDLPQQPVTTDRPQMKQTENYHGLTVGDLGLLLASDKVVSEIFETLPQCALPNTPAWVHAMANQRGNIIPIFDLAIMLGMPKMDTKRPYYMVIGQNEDAFGVLLDRLPEKVRLQPEDELENRPPIPRKLAPFVNRSYGIGGRIWLEWEPIAFIAATTQ